MAKAPKSDGRYGERLLAQRKAVAAEFDIADISDWRVRRLALLQAQHAAAEDMIADGRAVDINGLLSLDKAIEDLRATLKASEGIEIDLQILKRVVGVFKCCKCGERNEILDCVKPEPPPALPAPAAQPPAPVFAKPAAEPAKDKDKSSPVVTHREGVSASKFHSAVINGVAPPLKKDQPPLYPIRSVSPMSNGKG